MKQKIMNWTCILPANLLHNPRSGSNIFVGGAKSVLTGHHVTVLVFPP